MTMTAVRTRRVYLNGAGRRKCEKWTTLKMLTTKLQPFLDVLTRPDFPNPRDTMLCLLKDIFNPHPISFPRLLTMVIIVLWQIIYLKVLYQPSQPLPLQIFQLTKVRPYHLRWPQPANDSLNVSSKIQTVKPRPLSQNHLLLTPRLRFLILLALLRGTPLRLHPLLMMICRRDSPKIFRREQADYRQQRLVPTLNRFDSPRSLRPWSKELKIKNLKSSLPRRKKLLRLRETVFALLLINKFRSRGLKFRNTLFKTSLHRLLRSFLFFILTHVPLRLISCRDKKPLTQQASIHTEMSDPIDVFSSPHVLDMSRPSSKSTKPLLLVRSPYRPSYDGPRQSTGLKPMTSFGGSDPDFEDLPEVNHLVAEENNKQDQERQRQELLEKKQRLLAQKQARAPSINDDDDDLEIVPSRPIEVVIRKEEAERKLGKKKVSEGRKRQLNFGGIGLAAQKAKATPAKAHRLTFLSNGMKGPKTKGENQKLSQGELNKVLALQVMETSKQLSEEKQEEWKRRGGRVIDDTASQPISFADAQQAYAQKGLSVVEGSSMTNVGQDEDDESDEDWSPEARGSASPSPRPEGDDADDEDQELAEDADITMVNDENADDLEDEGIIKTRLPRRSLAIIDSDSEMETHDENVLLNPQNLYTSVRHRGSLSSMDEPTEDDNDKENNTALMFDRSDDKENKAVVRHSNTNEKVPLGLRKGSLFDLEGDVARGLSLSPRTATRSVDETDEDENRRKPLKDLLDDDDDDDPFLSRTSALKATPSFTDRLAQSSPAAILPSAGPAFTPFTGSLGKEGFSQFPEELSAFGSVPLQPGFSDLFESGTEKQSITPLKQQLGLSASFSEYPEPTGNAFRKLGPSLELTQDVVLQPAFQVGDGILKKADQIFEKEQGYLIEAAAKKPQNKEPELYVNDHGFLTQTRPDVSSPEVYRPPTTSQQYESTFSGQLEPPSTQRHPLRTLSLSGSTSFDSPTRAPLRRLQKRNSPSSPTETYSQAPSESPSVGKLKLNAFDVLKGAAKSKAEKSKRPLEKSEFVEAEAQESDDDEMFGFGHKKVDDGDEDDGEDLDKNLEALVDDREINEEDVAEELVREKHKEHLELDDQVLQKIHEDAIHGEYRKKRRNHGVGINDSDDDTDDDEKSRRIRKGMHKRQKVDRDDIKALAGNEETRAFYTVYEHGIMDNDENEFGYLQESQDVVMADQVAETQEDQEPIESISRTEVERLVRERAQQRVEDDLTDNFSPHDVSWIDGDESDGDIRVKPVTQKKQPGTRRRGLNHGDFDAGFESAPNSELITEGTMDRLSKWAKVEGRSRNAGTTGRSVGGAAVTGHATRAKTGGGSLRNNAAGSSSSTSTSKVPHRRPEKAKASFLKGVVADKSSLFDER